MPHTRPLTGRMLHRNGLWFTSPTFHYLLWQLLISLSPRLGQIDSLAERSASRTCSPGAMLLILRIIQRAPMLCWSLVPLHAAIGPSYILCTWEPPWKLLLSLRPHHSSGLPLTIGEAPTLMCRNSGPPTCTIRGYRFRVTVCFCSKTLRRAACCVRQEIKNWSIRCLQQRRMILLASGNSLTHLRVTSVASSTIRH